MEDLELSPVAWDRASVFLTGGAGFLGAWLSKALLERGAQVVCLVRDGVPSNLLELLGIASRVHIVRGDVCDLPTLARAINEYESKVVFHLAAQSLVGTANRSPLGTFESNIKGTWNILEAARQLPELVHSVVVASSDKAYGAAELPYREDQGVGGLHPYDVSKSCADLISRSYAQTWNLPVTVTRCGNLYGGGDLNFNRIVPDTIRALVEGRAPQLRSNGTHRRDYLHVRDAAEAYIRLAELTPRADVRGRAFNFGHGSPISVLEIVERLCEIHGSQVEPIILDTAKSEITDQYLDCTRARELLGWEPQRDLQTGLAQSYAWYKEYLEARTPRSA